jgi:hypothetical protein
MPEKSIALKKFPTIGVCGLDCGLCPRYYTNGPSRCPGCGGVDFFSKHPSCSFITCCVKRKALEVCAECDEYPCAKFKSKEEYDLVPESSSYPPYRKVLSNLSFIQKNGVKEFVDIQKRRIEILEVMLLDFNEGRSRSFFCRACALLEIKELERAWNKANFECKSMAIGQIDVKTKSKILKKMLEEVVAKGQQD